MKRNRSIRTLPLDNLTLFKHPLPEPTDHEKLCFGEEVPKENLRIFDNVPLLSSDDSDTILCVRDVGNSKSSSSSLSWGEEFKSEASKKVHEELERMNRVLRGQEPIPDNYDKEEYEEWMHFFPNLCVMGTKIDHCSKAANNNICDKIEIKKTVIDQIYSPKITLNDSLDVDSFLKVSPLGVSRLTRRQPSSRSLISSQISSSKWLKDEEYESLPFLSGVRNGKNLPPKGILKNSLVLPPIEITQFRSISATPRRESKSLSALSMKDQKYSGFKRKIGKDLCK